MGNRTCRTALPDGLHQYGIFDSTSASTDTTADSTDSSAADAVYEDTQEFMGTYIMVRTYGEHAQAGAEAAFARAKELEQVFSNTIADSEVNKVNGAAKAAVGTEIPISADLGNVLYAALEYGKKRRHAGLHHWRPDRPVGHRHRPRCHSRRRPHTGTAPTGGLERCPL